MKTRHKSLIPAFAAVCLPVGCLLGSEPLAVSGEYRYHVDTLDGVRYVKTAAVLDEFGVEWKVSWRLDDTVRVTAPDGNVTTLAEDAVSAGCAAWKPDGGGVWTVESSSQGTASFAVRHSLFGEQGAGTESDPVRFVDGDELSEMSSAGTVGDACFFTLADIDGLVADLALPSGYRLMYVDGDVWRIDRNADGCIFEGGGAVYGFDGLASGPNRRMRLKEVFPLSFSGDNWRGVGVDAVLTVTSPSGEVETIPVSGDGSMPFSPDEEGCWKVDLATGDVSLHSEIRVFGERFFVIIR